jgi:4-amino-4-deoxy-L-arabinose transferase-like glycosyltransferase
MGPEVARRDVAYALGLSILTVLSRLPYRAHMLYNWDAVQFALALREYNIEKHQPHPPGYILYVLLGRLLDARLHDANAAYVTLAVIFSGLTTFVVYVLARTMYDRATAVVAATLLAVSPLFWFYGSVGLTYAGEALAASTVAYLAYRTLTDGAGRASIAALALGLAGGIRQSILIVLFPLWLGATVLGTRRVSAVLRSAALLTVATLSWFLPMVWLTGGLGRYLAASRLLAESMVKPTTIGATTLDVTLAQTRYLLESVVVGLGPLALTTLALPSYVRRRGWGTNEWFLVAWVVPPALVYALVHFGQAGYVLTFLPALVILLARVLLTTLADHARLPGRARVWGRAAAVLVIVLVNGSFFVSARPLPRDFETPGWQHRLTAETNDWIWSRTAAALREHERIVRGFVDGIRGLYDPAETAVITEFGNPRSYTWLRHAMFYLPEYAVYQLRVDGAWRSFYSPQLATTILPLPGTQIRLPAGVRRLVWFVDHWSPTTGRPRGLSEIELPHGRYLYVLDVGRRPVRYAGYTFVRERPPRAGRTPR